MRRMMIIAVIAALAVSMLAVLTGCGGGARSVEKENKEMREKAAFSRHINVKIGRKKYTATLENNRTAKKFYKRLPETYKMINLNGNEIYKDVKFRLPKKERKIRKIRKGDIMLYGSDCIVIFYKTFKTTYKYTRIGRLDSTWGLAKATKKNEVKVKFSKIR